MKATVVRDGREQDIEARDIVPGDIVSTIPLEHILIVCSHIAADRFGGRQDYTRGRKGASCQHSLCTSSDTAL